MDGTFDQRLLQYFAQRDKAAKSLKAACSDVGANVKSEVKRLTGGTSVEEIIVAHPFITTGVAVGAGVLASRLLTGRAPAIHSSSDPQRVVIEIKHSGAAVAAAPAAQGFDPMAFIMKAVAGYETVQNLWRNYHDSRTPSPEVVTSASENASI